MKWSETHFLYKSDKLAVDQKVKEWEEGGGGSPLPDCLKLLNGNFPEVRYPFSLGEETILTETNQQRTSYQKSQCNYFRSVPFSLLNLPSLDPHDPWNIFSANHLKLLLFF